jgi:HlyD family secretion protein
MLLAFVTLFAAVILIAVVGWILMRPRTEVIQGQVDATEVRVSGKVPGRILELRVEEGQQVHRGDTLVFLDSPDVQAKLEQAQAARDAAQAQNEKVRKGTRHEQLDAAFEMWQKAKSGLEIAEKSYQRVQNLFDQGVLSAQKRDEAEANFKAMKATEKAAFSQYDMAKNGAEREDRMAAEALVNRAKGAVSEVESYINETFLLSPVDGEISEIFPQPGELVGSGAPIMNVLDKKDMWVVFNVREDQMKDMQIGNVVNGHVIALDRDIPMKVYYMKDMGSYASWKATKASGQYDFKTFEIKARPTGNVEGLYPGMSVIIVRKEAN